MRGIWRARCFGMDAGVTLVVISEAHICSLYTATSSNVDGVLSRTFEGSIVVLQELFYSLNLVFEPLFLVCSGANPDIALDSDDSVLVKQSMALSNDSHAVVPRAFWSSR